jgi:DNA repair exonuclease SbcCD ATPase subunit
LGTAQQRLAEARSAGAATFAPLEVRFAEERLDQARAAMQKRDYTATANLADESEANSTLAGIKARLGKLRESVDTLRKDNSEIGRAIGPDADPDGVAR